ncbi:MAG: M81 family metallopeptidase [Acidimicrobiia bacterium]|nr:M81 family metallopeptidase [Acidimicrobiia bacterium]
MSKKLRIGIGGIWHESNSFCIRDVTAEDFTRHGRTAFGGDILEHSERRDEVAGFAEVLRQHRHIEIVPLISAETWIAGHLSSDAVGFLEGSLRRGLREAGKLDGICFAPHGAMAGAAIADVDGHLINVFREELGPGVPVILTLDCHAVLTRQMLDLSTAVVAYRTHPHVDVVETGVRAANILLDTLAGKLRPVTAMVKIPLLLPPPDDGTKSGALKELFDKFIAWDRIDNVIAASLCPSYPWQNVPEQGWAAVVVTNHDVALADRLARELAQACWEARFRLLPEPMVTPHEAVRQAALAKGFPILITDSADTVGSGAPGDNTVLLAALLEMCHEVNGLALAHLPDPEAVSRLKSHRVGDTVTLRVGGKRDTRYCSPLTVTGEILCITEGPITNDGKFIAEPMAETGSIVCLSIQNVRLVLTEREIMGPQPSVFRKVGIEPFEAKVVTLKTGIGFKVTYGHVAKAVIRADCPGVVSYNLRNYDFNRVPRPMFPIDDNAHWELPAR